LSIYPKRGLGALKEFKKLLSEHPRFSSKVFKVPKERYAKFLKEQ
jgi:hypothetical protein